MLAPLVAGAAGSFAGAIGVVREPKCRTSELGSSSVSGVPVVVAIVVLLEVGAK